MVSSTQLDKQRMALILDWRYGNDRTGVCRTRLRPKIDGRVAGTTALEIFFGSGESHLPRPLNTKRDDAGARHSKQFHRKVSQFWKCLRIYKVYRFKLVLRVRFWALLQKFCVWPMSERLENVVARWTGIECLRPFQIEIQLLAAVFVGW